MRGYDACAPVRGHARAGTVGGGPERGHVAGHGHVQDRGDAVAGELAEVLLRVGVHMAVEEAREERAAAAVDDSSSSGRGDVAPDRRRWR